MTLPLWLYVLGMSLVALTIAYRLFPGVAYRLSMKLERRLAGLRTRQVMLSNGINVVYSDGGRGDPLLLLHGFTADRDHWTRVARHLTPTLRVIAPDLPGFGRSSRETTHVYSIDNQLVWLEDLVARLGLQRFHLGGSSMGGALAALFAARHPDRVTSLWLLAPAGVASAAQSEMERLLTTGEHPLIPQSAAQFEQTLDFVFARRPFVPVAVRRYLAREAVGRAALHTKIFGDLLNDENSQFSPLLNPAVEGLRTPALIVWGSNDRVLHPAGADVLEALMPAARLRIMTGAGHLPMLERPAQAAADYLEFYRTVAPKPIAPMRS